MSQEIKFGTDGWRSVIADGFTFANVRRVAQAACDVARQTSRSRLIVVGWDNRFFSDRYADVAAAVAAGNGFRAERSSAPLTSPALAHEVHRRKAALGFMITASHNPAIFNGFKLKGAHGGSVDESVTRLVEGRLDAGDLRQDPSRIKSVDFIKPYVAALKRRVSSAVLRRLSSTVVFDAMHGTGGAIFQSVVTGAKNVRFIRIDRDPLFGGKAPEPIEANLGPLRDEVLRSRAGIGIAVDGDGDRIGVIDEKGRYLPPHTVMPLILLHLIEGRRLKGKVVQTVSMGFLPGRIAARHKLPFEEVAVGFKHIAKRMGEEKVLLGGEESGGYGVGLWSPERDGLLCALLLLEMLAVRKRPLSAIVDDLYRDYGVSHFKRVDFGLKDGLDKEAWTNRIAGLVSKTIAGQPVKNVITMDGVKVVVEDDSWLLMRPSGTEPLLRTYSEGTSVKTVDELLREAERIANTPAPSPKSADRAVKNKRRR